MQPASTQIMSSLSGILNIVLSGNNKFCCLCFSTKIVGIGDELSIQVFEKECEIPLREILQSIFGHELQEYLTIFENICEDCLKCVISIYTFIQTRHYNAILLMQALDGLNGGIQSTKNDLGENKSLFVCINLKNFTTKHLYDTKKLDSTKAALESFNSLNAPKTKELLTRNKSVHWTKHKKKKTPDIKTSDMLLDPNNQLLHKCKVCLKEFLCTWNLRNHFFRVHAPKDHKCPKCPKKFGSPNLAAYHMGDHCKKVCNKCGKTFKNKATLKRHESIHHIKLVCADCGRTYKSKITYKKHLKLNVCKQECRANPANAQFTCDYCNKKYTQKMSLRVHIQYVHGNYKAHVCEWCGKKFWAKSRLKAHIVKHTKEKQFTCSTCEGKFVTKESLLYHTRLHTGEKPYKCSQCQCAFISASRRAYHMKKYHLFDTEECDFCHSKFTSRIYLEKHKKLHEQSQDREGIESSSKKPNTTDSRIDNRQPDRKINEKFITKKSVLDTIEMPDIINQLEFDRSNNQEKLQALYVLIPTDLKKKQVQHQQYA